VATFGHRVSITSSMTNAVIIRASKDCDYGQVYQLLRSCADAGFRNLKVRAIVYN